MQALGINAGNLFVNVCCFGIAFLIICKFVVGPVQNMLDKRNAAVKKGIEDAKAAAAARENSEAEREKILAEARKEADLILENARKEAEQQKESFLTEAQQQLDRKEQDLRASAAEERDQMLADMRPQIVELAVNCARKIVGDKLLGSEEAQHQVFEELISGMAAGSDADIQEFGSNLQKAEVITAVPLTPEEKQQLHDIWSRKSGNDIRLSWLVDPSIMGGMKIRSESALLDLSIAGKTADIRRAMLK